MVTPGSEGLTLYEQAAINQDQGNACFEVLLWGFNEIQGIDSGK